MGIAMLDDRDEPRVLVLKTGRIVCAGASSPIDCAVLNISASGACILVPPGVMVPTSFALAIDQDAAMHDCTVAWRDGARLGVRFATSDCTTHDERPDDGRQQTPGRADSV